MKNYWELEQHKKLGKKKHHGSNNNNNNNKKQITKNQIDKNTTHTIVFPPNPPTHTKHRPYSLSLSLS
jgi:hypothetical protein